MGKATERDGIAVGLPGNELRGPSCGTWGETPLGSFMKGDPLDQLVESSQDDNLSPREINLPARWWIE